MVHLNSFLGLRSVGKMSFRIWDNCPQALMVYFWIPTRTHPRRSRWNNPKNRWRNPKVSRLFPRLLRMLPEIWKSYLSSPKVLWVQRLLCLSPRKNDAPRDLGETNKRGSAFLRILSLLNPLNLSLNSRGVRMAQDEIRKRKSVSRNSKAVHLDFP